MQVLGPCQRKVVHYDTLLCELEVLGIGQKNKILQMSVLFVVMLLHSKLLWPSGIMLD